MTAQTDIPPDLTDDFKAYLFWYRDGNLNSTILYAQLHGIYTGILAVTLWSMSVNKHWPVRRALIVVVVVVLYALTTINFASTWVYIQRAFIDNGHNFWTEYLKLGVSPASYLETGITSSMSTVLADSYIIWCCWMVWGRLWPIVLLPILSLICAIVFKVFEIYLAYMDTSWGVYPILYLSFILATTLYCTLLIVLRILTVTGVRRGVGGRLKVFGRFIGVLVESSALYSIALILYLACSIREDFRLYYFGVIGGIAKGVAPTLLIGRAAAGHTRPNEEHDGTLVVSAIRFQMFSLPVTSNFQDSTTQNALLETDIEARPEQ